MFSQKNNVENYQKLIIHAECALNDFPCILRVCTKIYLHAEHAIKTFFAYTQSALKSLKFSQFFKQPKLAQRVKILRNRFLKTCKWEIQQS
jgi:hypothetical protein